MAHTIIYFARTPEPGYGKTRLRKDVPSHAVDEIARLLYDNLYDDLSEAEGQLVLHYDGKKPNKSIPCVHQKGYTLGERMDNALKAELIDGPTVLVGCDLIGVDANYIKEAFDALINHDVVLGPAEDGGYGLVGMRDYVDVFSGIEYSRPDVLENTVKKAKEACKTVALLRPIHDVDEIDDLARIALNSPIRSSYKCKSGMIFHAENDLLLQLFFEKPKDTRERLLPPTTMMPFFHCILKS